MSLKIHGETLPEPSALVALAQVVELLGVEEVKIIEVVDLGWIQPARTEAQGMLFRARDVYRLRKLCRICEDFELPYIGGTIIVDLLERVERLEHRIRELEKLL